MQSKSTFAAEEGKLDLQRSKRRGFWHGRTVGSLVVISIILFVIRSCHLGAIVANEPRVSPGSLAFGQQNRCPEQPLFRPITRPDITEHNVKNVFSSDAFRNESAERLSGAVQIQTVINDDMGKLSEDPRWNIFYDFGNYLKKAFPALHKTLNLTTINEHALLYTWLGSDTELKSLLFMAHQDVVPVPDTTLDRWTYPPFSGHIDENYVWGRGSEDDKSNLIAILIALDALVKVDFKPTRTIIVSIGFDEEASSLEDYGAGSLSAHLLESYGPDSMEIIFDEGVPGIENHFGTEFALPATAEKGYVDISVTVNMDGGHSSVPPDHTAIGYLAQLIKQIEESPFRSQLSELNPTAAFLSCAASYGAEIPDPLRDAILDPKQVDTVIEYMESSLESRALIRTSQAVDIVAGGVKVNALPETAHAVINHRIAVEDSQAFVREHYMKLISSIAKEWNFDVRAFEAEQDSVVTQQHSALGTVILTADGDLEPSPVTNASDVRFNWLAGTIRGVFGEDVVVAPVLLTGNTDTKFYWKLSNQIIRWSPWRASLDPRGTNMHTVDERMPIDGLLEMIRFYHEFIRIVDEKRS